MTIRETCVKQIYKISKVCSNMWHKVPEWDAFKSTACSPGASFLYFIRFGSSSCSIWTSYTSFVSSWPADLIASVLDQFHNVEWWHGTVEIGAVALCYQLMLQNFHSVNIAKSLFSIWLYTIRVFKLWFWVACPCCLRLQL